MATLVMMTGTPQLDLQASESWIDILHGNSPGLIHLCAAGDWSGRAFDWHKQRQEALAYIASRDSREGIYLRATTLKGVLEQDKRGSDKDSLALPGLWADIDLAGPGHKHQVCGPECDRPHVHQTLPLPPDTIAAGLIIHEVGLPEPSVWIHSGGGLYPYWIFREPVILDTPETLAAWRLVSQQWQDAIGAAATELDYSYGTGVGDLARVLRIPGTINRKEGLARPCRIIAENGDIYAADTLRELAAAVAPKPTPAPPRQTAPWPGFDGAGAGDLADQHLTWAQILEPNGWTFSHSQGQTDYWIRPGKLTRGHSASSGRASDRDRLYVFSEEAGLPTNQPLTKFFVYAQLFHGGDMKAAARELHRQFDPPKVTAAPAPQITPFTPDPGAAMPQSPPPAPDAAPILRRPKGRLDYTFSGAATRFVDTYGRHVRYVKEQKGWRVWNGINWEFDENGSQVMQAIEAMTEDMMDEADGFETSGQLDLEKALRKHIVKLRDSSRQSLMALIRPKVEVSTEDFDVDPRYLNLRNGIYDLVADRFMFHDPKYMMTKVAGISYDPDAIAPGCEDFFGSILPNDAMREFTLQAMGYSMTGEADRKAMIISQGRSNTGKTQISEMFASVLGDYAISVSPGTFTKRRENGPTPELHEMRGARFVYTSETSYDIQLDEEMVKRLTGKDMMTTRTLYEKPQRWIPQCVVWIATNNLPRFSSDDEAMWRRVKTVRFNTVYSDDGETGNMAVMNIGRSLADKEGAGLFNMLLAALRRYRSAGRLEEPQELKDSVAEHREETDPCVRYVVDTREAQDLQPKEGARADGRYIYRHYKKYCQDGDVLPLGPQRFGMFLKQYLKCETQRSNGVTYLIGWEFTGLQWQAPQTGFYE